MVVSTFALAGIAGAFVGLVGASGGCGLGLWALVGALAGLLSASAGLWAFAGLSAFAGLLLLGLWALLLGLWGWALLLGLWVCGARMRPRAPTCTDTHSRQPVFFSFFAVFDTQVPKCPQAPTHKATHCCGLRHKPSKSARKPNPEAPTSPRPSAHKSPNPKRPQAPKSYKPGKSAKPSKSARKPSKSAHKAKRFCWACKRFWLRGFAYGRLLALLLGLWALLLGVWALVGSVGRRRLCCACGRFCWACGCLCALAGERFCCDCGRVWAVVGGRSSFWACGRCCGAFAGARMRPHAPTCAHATRRVSLFCPARSRFFPLVPVFPFFPARSRFFPLDPVFSRFFSLDPVFLSFPTINQKCPAPTYFIPLRCTQAHKLHRCGLTCCE